MVERRAIAACVAAAAALSIGLAWAPTSRAAGATSRPADLSFAERLERQFKAAPGAGGGLAVDLRTGHWIWAHLPDRERVPASVTKLFTTATALLDLGPRRRIVTVVASPAGGLQAGLLTGSLYLKGGGDPSLGSDAIRSLARAVRARGITAVGGRVIGDDGFFDRIRGVPALGPGIDPDLEGSLGALVYDRVGSARTAAEKFTLALRGAGVSVGRGRVGTGTAPVIANRVTAHNSPMISTLVRWTNTPSDNFYAEMLLKLVGAVDRGRGSTSSGLAARAARMKSMGIDSRLLDGSGLSHGNRVTPRNVIRLLDRMEDNRHFTLSLAVAGRTGTLSGRMTRGAAAGRCRAKTGTLNGVASLAGYCPSPSGGNVAFVLLNNGTWVAGARARQDNIVQALAGWRRTAAPPPVAPASCTRPRGVVTLVFSASKYPNIRKHTLAAIRSGWPSVLVVNRRGASDRRDRLLGSYRTKRNYDRDEYPPAVGRGAGPGLTRGRGPTGWMASVWYVPSHENRSHGSSLGGKLRRYCDGTRFRYGFS